MTVKKIVDDTKRVGQLLWELRRLRRENASLVDRAKVRRLLEMTGVGWVALAREEDRYKSKDH